MVTATRDPHVTMVMTTTWRKTDVAGDHPRCEKIHAIGGPQRAGHLAGRRQRLPRASAMTGRAARALASETTEVIAARMVIPMLTMIDSGRLATWQTISGHFCL
jgi:hypothetical protein